MLEPASRRRRVAVLAAALVAAALALPAGANAEFPTPGAPALTAGANPSANGLFTLEWTGADPMQSFGLTYTLEHHDAETEAWTTVAEDIEALSFQFTGAGEAEGTWVYRVQGVDAMQDEATEYSPASEPVVVDETPPATPIPSADRAPDFAGGGGWYKNTVTVSFAANGDPALSDGSPGSGVDGASLTPAQSFSTSGSHTASGTVADNAGNLSAAGMLTVQVDATPPSLEVKCPETAAVGESASATVVASDGESGLASDPSGSVPVNTERAGDVTITRTAVDNVGFQTTRSCTTHVGESPPEYGRCTKMRSAGFFTSAACTTKGSTQTLSYEWTSGVLQGGFTGSTGSALFETVTKAKLTCSGGSDAGEITSAKTLGGVVLRFTGCTSAGSPCTTAGRSEGELESKTLEGALGIYKTSVRSGKETRLVGLSLHAPGSNTPFMEFNCGTSKTTTVLKGAAIAQVSAGKMLTVASIKYVQAVGKQKPERFLGGEREILTKATGEQVALKMSITQKYEEALEVNPFF